VEEVSLVYRSDEDVDDEDAHDPLSIHSDNGMDSDGERADDVQVEVEVEVENYAEVEIVEGFNNQGVQQPSNMGVGSQSTGSSGYATHGSRDIMEDLDDEEESPDFSLSFPDDSEEQVANFFPF
jgi:hypothetical protein